MRIETWPIDRPKPYPKNPRKIPDGAVDKVAASIREFGFRQPVVVDKKGVVIVGHTRLLAARKLGLDEIPVHVAEGLSKAQVRAYRLADNRTNQEAAWDDDLLGSELFDLKGLEFDLDLTGFGGDEIDRLFAKMDAAEGLTDPDDVPEAPEEPITQPGDVWILGRHRLVCGDCTDAETVGKCLNGVEPHLMVTDPPYGVEYDAAWRERYDRFERHSKGKFEGDERADWSEAWSLFPGDVAYVWHGALHSGEVQKSLERSKFRMRSQIIWTKQHFVFARGDYHWQHEPCWYAVRSTGKGHWSGDRKQTTVWEIANKNPMGGKTDDANTTHGTQKPVECMKRPIENNSSPGQAVYEPFSGSGTTIIAAEMTGRSCHAIEISPAYVDVAVKRWQQFTGKEAVRESHDEEAAA